MCDKEAGWESRAICCDECQLWVHAACADADSQYTVIGRDNVQWLCPRCDNINCDTFTFNSFEISCYNSFAPLSDDSQTRSINSFSSSDPFSPKHTSSPQAKQKRSFQNSSSSNKNSTYHTSQSQSTDRSIYDLPHKSNLRVVNFNCQSAKNKRAEIQATLKYTKPDLVCGTESKLEGIKPGKPPSQDHILSSEIFPTQEYNVFRNDRNKNGGDVFILAHKSLTVEEQPQLVTDCEINWIKI